MSWPNFATLERQLKETLTMFFKLRSELMSAISDYAAKQTAFNTQVSAALDNLAADIKTLNDKLTALQNSVGTISPEDQAALDQLVTAGQAVADKAAAIDQSTQTAVPPPVTPPPAAS